VIELEKALRFSTTSRLALVGAGGKSSVLLKLASSGKGLIATTTTHLAVEQASTFLKWMRVEDEVELEAWEWEREPVLVTGRREMDGRVSAPGESVYDLLLRIAKNKNLPVVVEADGAKKRMLKAPAQHEPVVPDWINHVLVVIGADGVGKPLNDEWVHRPERFSALSGIPIGQQVTWDSVGRVLLDAEGGLKNIPVNARCSVLINQVETEEQKAGAATLARMLLRGYDAVLIGAMAPKTLGLTAGVQAVYERIAGIVLAAGGSTRMAGKAKPLLTWRGGTLVQRAVETALMGGLSPVIVVAGEDAPKIRRILAGMDVEVIENLCWASGQSSSIQCGIKNLPEGTGAAVFLLVDQPYVSPVLIAQLQELHSQTMAAIVAPRVDGRRTNPILFDRRTFSDLNGLQGDVGGRGIFARYMQDWAWLDWQDERLLFDVDTLIDYERLLGDEGDS
jgi:molybdenum cofactor cytidylyltransferase